MTTPNDVPTDPVTHLRWALEACLSEMVTLRPRLPEPYYSNLTYAIDVAKAAMAATKPNEGRTENDGEP